MGVAQTARIEGILTHTRQVVVQMLGSSPCEVLNAFRVGCARVPARAWTLPSTVESLLCFLRAALAAAHDDAARALWLSERASVSRRFSAFSERRAIVGIASWSARLRDDWETNSERPIEDGARSVINGLERG